MQVKILRLHENTLLPKIQTPFSVGYDVHAYLDAKSNDLPTYVDLYPFKPKLIPLGFCLEMPNDMECQIRLRSGLGTKGLFIPNAPATVDPDFRGEVKVILCNMTSDTYRIYHGDRIAQLVFHTVQRPTLELVEELTPSERGSGGYGSTGQ